MSRITRKNSSIPLRIEALFAIVGGLIALVVALTVARDDDQRLVTMDTDSSSAIWIPSPTTVQDLVDISKAIVVAQIVGLQKQSTEGPFGDSGIADSRDNVPSPRQYPNSYFDGLPPF